MTGIEFKYQGKRFRIKQDKNLDWTVGEVGGYEFAGGSAAMFIEGLLEAFVRREPLTLADLDYAITDLVRTGGVK
jgi:hypothetical protein